MSSTTTKPLLSFMGFRELLAKEMPWAQTMLAWDRGNVFERGHVELIAYNAAKLSRPGGTVSGPAMFTLVDIALYAVVLSEIGLVPLAVTTDLTMHFMRKPTLSHPLVARARLLKAGARNLIGTCEVSQEGHLVACATGTYSRPPAEVPSASKM